MSGLGHKLVVGALLGDSTACHHDDAIGGADGRKSVRDDDASQAEILQEIDDDGLRHVIERTGGLIQQQHARGSCECSGEEDPLALAAGNGATAIDNGGVKPHSHLPNIVGHAGRGERLPDLG